jgi:hypothetical protein
MACFLSYVETKNKRPESRRGTIKEAEGRKESRRRGERMMLLAS